MTLTALKPSPFVIIRPIVEIELVLATADDLKIFIGTDASGKKIYKKRVNMIYWLKSSLTGIFEASPRVITEDDDPKQIKEWLDFGMIYIARSFYEG